MFFFFLEAKTCRAYEYNGAPNPQRLQTNVMQLIRRSLIEKQLLTIFVEELGDVQHVQRAQNFVNVSHCDVSAVFVHMVKHVRAATSAVFCQRRDVLKTSAATHMIIDSRTHTNKYKSAA